MAITLKEPYTQPLNKEWYESYVDRVDMLRLDVLHPVVSGNKWYKLKHNIKHALADGYRSILTFGGGYSNHLIAAAATAKAYGMRAIGIVRGVYNELTPTLRACIDHGMQLEFVSRDDYNRRTDAEWLNDLEQRFEKPFIIPEGGANKWGREGSSEIANYISKDYTHVTVSVGTGTTFAGLRNALESDQALLGYVPMKGGKYLVEEISGYISSNNWELFDEWHFGGFGKVNDELLSFMNDFYRVNNIPLDIVYTGKMMYGIKKQLEAGRFGKASQILCIHTGGLQGNVSVQEKLIY